MTLFAIGDLHLPGGEEKPMDIFGDHWENHFAHIAADWRARVKDGDVVLIPGDISWAMQLERAVPDLQKIGALPGRKVLIKGNHDYWWNSVSKLRRVLPEGRAPCSTTRGYGGFCRLRHARVDVPHGRRAACAGG